MELSAAEILGIAVAAAGALITAFMAGAKIFYEIGKAQGVSQGSIDRERLLQQVEKYQASISELDQTIGQLRGENIRLAGLAPPKAEQSLSAILDEILAEDDRDIWRTFPAAKPADHDEFVRHATVKIVAVANLKGGVGKTTTALNFAAYCDRILHRRVLFIDADYQGSATNVLMKIASLDESTSKVDKWLNPAGGEPPRVCRRLYSLRGWSHEQAKDRTEVFARGA